MANQVWCEVFDAADTKLGVVVLRQVTVSRGLDEAGTVLLAPLTGDENATTLLQVLRKARLFWEHPLKGKTQIGIGILQQRAGDLMLGEHSWSGLDEMEELRRANTLRGLIYDDQAIGDVVEDLLGNVSGWTARVESGLGNTSRRFDGVSILEAVRSVVTGAGLHLRVIGDRRIEIGTFGGDSGLRVTNLAVSTREAQHQSDLAILRNPLTLLEDGAGIVNWIEPVWGGGDAVLTLKRSTRTSPYPIQTTTGPNGKTVYYLKHDASIAQYGTVQAERQMDGQPYIAAEATALVNAANVLYDWAAADLTRSAYPQTSYSVSGIKLDKRLLPGEQIRLVYKGWVWHRGRRVRYAEIDDDFWVLRISESYDASGQSWAIDISTVDVQPMADTDLLANTIMKLQNQAIGKRYSAQTNRHTGEGTVNGSTPLQIDFAIANTTVDIGDAILTVTRDSYSGPHGVYVTVDGVQVGSTYMIDGQAANSFTLALDDALIADMDSLRGDHTVVIYGLSRAGTVTAALEVVEIGTSVD